MTEAQFRKICDQDLVILDPMQPNVIPALAKCSCGLTRIFGRLDLDKILNEKPNSHDLERFFIGAIDQIMTTVLLRFQNLEGRNNGFTGVLLANWESLPNPIFHELCDVLFTLGLDLYLETAASKFLKDSATIAIESVNGLVIRNALMRENAERMDCFDMEAFRMTVQAFVSQSCLRDFTVLAWETYDDDTLPTTAVLRRTFKWCSFYGIVPWIGPKSALSDSNVDVVRCEPLGAFDILKDSRVMELHELWRTKKDVSDSTIASVVIKLSSRGIQIALLLANIGSTGSRVQRRYHRSIAGAWRRSRS